MQCTVAYGLFLSSSNVTSLTCAKSLSDLLSALEHSLMFLCKPVCELPLRAIWLMYVGILRKIEMNILNLS